MLELGLVLGVLAGVVGSAALLALAPWWWLFGGGLALVGLGMLVGVPAGFFYHLALYRMLRPRALLKRGWWLHPTGLHAALSADELHRLRGWFFLGGGGFIIALAGCLFVAIGALRS
jgi:hypothetical protein